MRYLIPGVLVLAAAAFFFMQNPSAPPQRARVDDSRGEAAVEPISDPAESPAVTSRDLADATAVKIERAAVESPGPVAESDPCAEIVEAFNTSKAARVAAERERDELRDQVALLKLELLQIKYPEDTPYGAFLASGEAEQITDRFGDITDWLPSSGAAPRAADMAALQLIKEWLDLFPVFLRPGEGLWIAEREVNKDWKQYATTAERALIQFLGIERLIAELPEERIAELRADYEKGGLFD